MCHSPGFAVRSFLGVRALTNTIGFTTTWSAVSGCDERGWRRPGGAPSHLPENAMKTLLSAGLVGVLVLTGTAGEDNEAVKKDLKALAGKWKVESFEDGQGKKQELEGATLAFTGGNLEFTKDNETKKGKIKLNPDGKPKEIDVMAEGKDDAMLGVYH